MIPAAFEYLRAESLDHAVALLTEHGSDAKLLAGGHSLLPLMKLRLAQPSLLIDLGLIADLSFIEDRGDHLAIGPLATDHALEVSDVVGARSPLLAQAASTVGDMQVRNRATIGGSLAHGDPAADLPAVAMALGASLLLKGPGGERTIRAEDFFLDIWTTALEPDEAIAEVRVPTSQEPTFSTYEKFRQRAGDWATAGVAVQVLRRNGAVDRASIVLVNVGPTPIRAK